MTHIDLSTPLPLPAGKGYSHVASIEPGSRLVWTAGQVPISADGTPVRAGDWEAQTRLAMQNLSIALAGAGASWEDVFKLTIFVVDTSALPTIRAVRDEFVKPRAAANELAGTGRRPVPTRRPDRDRGDRRRCRTVT